MYVPGNDAGADGLAPAPWTARSGAAPFRERPHGIPQRDPGFARRADRTGLKAEPQGGENRGGVRSGHERRYKSCWKELPQKGTKEKRVAAVMALVNAFSTSVGKPESKRPQPRNTAKSATNPL